MNIDLTRLWEQACDYVDNLRRGIDEIVQDLEALGLRSFSDDAVELDMLPKISAVGDCWSTTTRAGP